MRIAQVVTAILNVFKKKYIYILYIFVLYVIRFVMRDNSRERIRAGSFWNCRVPIYYIYIYIIRLKKNLYISKSGASAIATRSMKDYVRFHARKRLFPLSDVYVYYVTLYLFF